VTTFLTPAELEQLTGKKQPAAQRRVLDKHGVRYFVRGDGRNVLVRGECSPWQPKIPPRRWPRPPMIPLSLDEIRALPTDDQIHEGPGLYFMLAEGQVVYIGLSVDVPSRLEKHHYDRKFRQVKHWDVIHVLTCGPDVPFPA